MKQKSTYHFILSFNLGGWKLLFVIRKSALKKANSISVVYIAVHMRGTVNSMIRLQWKKSISLSNATRTTSHIYPAKRPVTISRIFRMLTSPYLCSTPSTTSTHTATTDYLHTLTNLIGCRSNIGG